MLSWQITVREGLGVMGLWKRFDILFPKVLELTTEDTGVSFQMLRDHVWETQGKKITPNKLAQRGDKTQRYAEFNALKEQVIQAYEICCGLHSSLPDTDFTSVQILKAARRQGGKCFVCEAKLGVRNRPCGDHIIARSSGGRNTDENCAAICHNCNTRKGAMTLARYMAKFREEGKRGRLDVALALEKDKEYANIES